MIIDRFARLARHLGQDEDLLWALSDQLEPEDGKLWSAISMESQPLPLATSASRPFAKSFETSSNQRANRGQLVVPSNPARRGPNRMLTALLSCGLNLLHLRHPPVGGPSEGPAGAASRPRDNLGLTESIQALDALMRQKDWRARQVYNNILHDNASLQTHFGRSGLTCCPTIQSLMKACSTSSISAVEHMRRISFSETFRSCAKRPSATCQQQVLCRAEGRTRTRHCRRSRCSSGYVEGSSF